MNKSTGNMLDAAGEAALERALRRAWHPVCRADELNGTAWNTHGSDGNKGPLLPERPSQS